MTASAEPSPTRKKKPKLSKIEIKKRSEEVL